ncbi:hypothetical protein MRB53_028027 [Persea americana]|uniref:Uncharacterized protein n=1 Tax=Persea americana TaxID=3435 RepID=A0ACC2KF05_PERAE|nr:hypothetical protein MRB53_028027 [Persea americana]
MACVDSSKFSEPLPWIGLYITAASLLCSLLMGLDTFNSFRRRKLWFPCRCVTLNATSLTLLSVATKLPIDLNTSMPSSQDQLTKLSGTIFICTVMGNFLTSLGTMDESEMIANIIALGILVVTAIVNIGIQMGTGVIYVFLPEHAIIMSLMLVLLVIFCSTAIIDPTPKKLLERKYRKILKISGEIHMGSDEIHMGSDVVSHMKKLREKVEQYCMVVNTSCHQYVVGRSATCTASGAICFLCALILVQAAVRSLIIRSVEFCEGKSDYKWSVTLVLISQAIAIVVGSIAPTIRWMNAIRFHRPKIWNKRCLKIGKFWIRRLVEWKEKPLQFHIGNRRYRKIFLVSKIQVLNVFIGMQSAVVIVSNLIALTSILPMSWLISFFSCCNNRLGKEELTRSESELGSNKKKHLLQWIMTNGREDAQHWIHRGKENQPNYLMELLMKSTISQGFQGVVEFDSNQVPLLGTETRRPPNCWALPIVNLTSIAIAIAFPYVETDVIKSLHLGVHEGLKYVRLIEEHLDRKRTINVRNAADIVWLGIDIDDHWLDEDLKKLALQIRSADGILKTLAQIGERYVLNYISRSRRKAKEKDPHEWPAKILAANSMYRLCQTILLKRLGTADMFGWLQKVIADMLAACLSNLPRVISTEFSSLPIELKEENIRDAAHLIGEAEEILTKLDINQFPESTADIDDWILNKQIKNGSG